MKPLIKVWYILITLYIVFQVCGMVEGIADMVHDGETIQSAIVEFADQIERIIPIAGLGEQVQNNLRELWFSPDDSFHICTTLNDPLPCDSIELQANI